MAVTEKRWSKVTRRAKIVFGKALEATVAALLSGFRLLVVCAIALWLFGSQLGPSAQDKHSESRPVAIQMRNVNYRLTRDIVLEVRTLRGQLKRTKPDLPVTFDDPESFTVKIDSGQVAVSP